MVSVPRSPGVYKITCTTNGKFYIGSAKDIWKRWVDHKSDLRRNVHDNPHLQNAWNRYGEPAFVLEVIELVMPWSAKDREQHYLDTLKPWDHTIGFNIARIAESGMRGRKHSPEARAKISAGLKGHKNALGKKHSPEAFINKSRASKGHVLSNEARAKIGTASRGRKHSVESEERRIDKISTWWIVINPDGIEMKIKNLRKFCRENGLAQQLMCNVANGKQRQHKGWGCKRL